MSTGTRIARARKKQNLTQEQLAEQLDVTRQSVSRWESDSAYPETDKLVRLAQILGVSCDYLLQGGEAPRQAAAAPSPVTRLLRQAAGRKVQLSFFDSDTAVPCDWCTILEFDGAWANVEFVRTKRNRRETRLVPLSSIRSITFLREAQKGGQV